MAITNEGDSQTFSYTGGMQTFTVPQKGVYKLEVVGAMGGKGWTNDQGIQDWAKGLGGYGLGYKMLEKDQVLYICCGGAGGNSTSGTYNGGGGGAKNGSTIGGQGGGATHIATMSGTLSGIGKSNISKILIVAGGGGGGSHCGYGSYEKRGGNGGGENGEKQTYGGAGGTQSSGYAFGKGETATKNGYWEDMDSEFASGGGGGGLYGGYAGTDMNYSGGGGSGYIGGVPSFTYNNTTYSPSWTTGSSLSTGNGYAKITFIKKGELPVTFNGTKLQKIIFNGTEITSLIYNGTKLF